MNKLISIISTCLLASVVCADPVTVPNTFSTGTPAKASEVNANFTALANAVNNSLKPLMVYDSTGKVLGQYVPTETGNFVLVNANGTILKLTFFDKNSVRSPRKMLAYYRNGTCEGDPYFVYLTNPGGNDPAGGTSLEINKIVQIGFNIGNSSYVGYVDQDLFSKGIILDFYASSVLGDDGQKTSCQRETIQQWFIAAPMSQVPQFDLSIFSPPFSVH